jgi:hypothetical protein
MVKLSAAIPRLLVCLSCFALPIASWAECRKAQDNEVPHGANELIELKEQKVHDLFGTVFLPNHRPAGNVVRDSVASCTVLISNHAGS